MLNKSLNMLHDWQQQLLQNREHTFRLLYEEVYPAALRWVKLQGGQAEAGEDVFQDALIVLFEKARDGKLSGLEHPRGYLLGTVRRLWWRRRRNACRYRPLVTLEEDPPAGSEEEEGRIPEVWRYLERAGQRCLKILQAFYYFRWPMSEIAEHFGYRSTRSATVQKYKCLEKVRKSVKQPDYAESPA